MYSRILLQNQDFENLEEFLLNSLSEFKKDKFLKEIIMMRN